LRFFAFLMLIQVGGQMVFFPAFEEAIAAHSLTCSADGVDCPTEFSPSGAVFEMNLFNF
jgi:hypothetical protein